MDEIKPGVKVLARDALGALLERRAVTSVELANNHEVVWVCKEEEWLAAEANSREPEAVPWPAEDVHLVGAETATA